MDVLELPITQNLGIIPSDKEPYLLKLVFGKPNQNHVHSVHASAFFALAEITG